MAKTIITSYESEYEIDRSRFIAYIFPLRQVADFAIIHQQIKKMHPQATHICYAYRFQSYQKYSDDGEPVKTAGFPLLELIHHSDLDEIAILVVRYFGGIKLGTGGLMRSYRKSAQQVLEKSTLYTMEKRTQYRLIFHPSFHAQLEHFFLKNKILIEQKDFQIMVTYVVASATPIIEDLVQLTSNQITIESLGEKTYYIK